MKYYGANELANSFRTVRKNTIAIAEEIPAEKYGLPLATGMRTVGQSLTHIAQLYRVQYEIHGPRKVGTLVGFDFGSLVGALIAEEQKPRDKAQIVALLKESGEACGNWLAGLSDDFLAESVEMPQGAAPPSKSRFEMILSIKEHEMHHRGQLMVFQRSIGQVPHLTREMMARMSEATKK
jgi:uncharacterized damage-inducible protein DinB